MNQKTERFSPALVVALTVAVLAISSAATGIRLAAPLEPGVIAADRVWISSALLFVLAPRSSLQALRMFKQNPRLLFWTVCAGALLALHFVTWISSLSYASITVAVTLVSTQTIFAALLGRFVGERAPPQLYFGALVAILGAAIMVFEPSMSDAPRSGSSTMFGALLALLGAAAMAGYLLVGRQLREQLPLAGYFTVVNLSAALLLTVLAWSRGSSIIRHDVDASSYLAVLYLGIVPGILGHGLMNWSVRQIPVYVVSLVALLEPVGAAILGWLLLSEVVRLPEAIGGSAVLFGVALGLRSRR